MRATPAFFAAITLLVIASAGSPRIRPQWTEQYGSKQNVVLLTPLTFLISSQVLYQGVYNNTIQATNTSNSAPMWTFDTLGEAPYLSTAFAFPAIPEYFTLFLVANNVQPPNVTAIDPVIGRVVWSSSAMFSMGDPVSNLLSSLDGRTVYLLTTSPTGLSQLTAFDAGTGDVLFGNNNVGSPVVVTQCGRSPSGTCLAAFDSSTGNVTFIQGRSGQAMGSVLLGWASTASLISASTDQLLVAGTMNFSVINTTRFSVACSQPLALGSSVQPISATTSKRVVVVVMSQTGLVGYDSRTGVLLWNTTAAAVCPSKVPATGFGDWYSFAALPIGFGSGNLFSFAATCSYPAGSNPSELSIVGAMSAVDGTTRWWRYIPSPSGAAYPITLVGYDYFALQPPSAGVAEFYDSEWKIFGSFPKEHSGYSLDELYVHGRTVLAASRILEDPQSEALTLLSTHQD